MIWARMDYDSRLAVIAQLARDDNSVTTIARVLSTSNENIWAMAREHSVYIHTTRPGHAVPDPDDGGMGGGDPFARKLAAWRRATQGARETLMANENIQRTNQLVDDARSRSLEPAQHRVEYSHG